MIFMKTVPLTKAKARLSGLVDRLILQKEQIVITKHGKPVAAMVPYADWEQHLAGGREGLAAVAPPAENLDAEIDAMIKEIYVAREKSKSRKPSL
jgi:prevent-host-death family protein